MGGERGTAGGGRRSRPPARVPPSESTGREVAFLQASRESSAPVVVHLRDGFEARGVIVYYDDDVIKLERAVGPGVLIRKRDIRYVAEDPEPAT